TAATGHHFNTTHSALPITHIPTPLIPTSSQKSQIQNPQKPLKLLKPPLFHIKLQQHQQKYPPQPKSPLATPHPSQPITTYNYPQTPLTHHPIPLTLQKLHQIIQGNLHQIIHP
ncbi:peptide chain release factor-like protein, partial [Staphylococcus saprophyticus]|uniref:peptide chain release factor-like protein n=1 Tax=Staphylococcus saprophyticus TaxID=29385 RepID=UPI003703C759